MTELGRIKTAVEFLKDGLSFKVGNLRLGMSDTNDMFVIGWSQYLDPGELTRQLALRELDEIKKLFNMMLDASGELKDFVQDKGIKYNLAFDYGISAVGICSEKDGVVEWNTELGS